eukprot:752938_1
MDLYMQPHTVCHRVYLLSLIKQRWKSISALNTANEETPTILPCILQCMLSHSVPTHTQYLICVVTFAHCERLMTFDADFNIGNIEYLSAVGILSYVFISES